MKMYCVVLKVQNGVHQSSLFENKDCSITSCGDFKVTSIPYLSIDQHPIPRIEDLLNEIQKDEYFSKIDLSQAFMQLKLDYHMVYH